MWIGSIEELKKCPLLSELVKTQIADFFNKNNVKLLPNGRYDLGNGNYVNIFEYDTIESDGIFEAHKVYVDIHYAISGEEKILHAESYQQETKPYQADGDYSLGTVNTPKEIEMRGELCVFLPDEPHKAGVTLSEMVKVKKVVFKIIN